VAFHLVCLSRLEASADIKSNLVLFLTLVVFTGPYLNAWLVFAEYIIFKKWDECAMTFENMLKGAAITAAHVVGSLLAWGCVLGMQPPSVNSIIWDKKQAITWNMTDDALKQKAMNDDSHWHVHLFEEIFAVTSLLIGFIYLLWLTKMRKEKITHKHEDMIRKDENNDVMVLIDIKFYFQLTLLVAAVAQAFPSAQLSPHVLSYKLLMQTITIPQFLARLGGGAIGLIIACWWCLFRVSYRESIQKKLDPNHDHNYEKVQTSENEMGMKGMNSQMPSIRLSMHGGSYF